MSSNNNNKNETSAASAASAPAKPNNRRADGKGGVCVTCIHRMTRNQEVRCELPTGKGTSCRACASSKGSCTDVPDDLIAQAKELQRLRAELELDSSATNRIRVRDLAEELSGRLGTEKGTPRRASKRNIKGIDTATATASAGTTTPLRARTINLAEEDNIYDDDDDINMSPRETTRPPPRNPFAATMKPPTVVKADEPLPVMVEGGQLSKCGPMKELVELCECMTNRQTETINLLQVCYLNTLSSWERKLT